MLEELSPAPLAGTWDGALLQPITEINQRLLENLHLAALAWAPAQLSGTAALGGASSSANRMGVADAADVTDTAGATPVPRLVMLLWEDWRRLDSAAQQRLASCPYLLVDAGFGQPERWERLPLPAVREAPAPSAYFQSADGIALMRRTLLFAWHLARSNRLGARVLLGMGARAAERIAATRLQDLDALAECGPPWIVPRWEQQPTVWRQLIRAAYRLQGPQLRLAQLRGLQLLAASASGPRA